MRTKSITMIEYGPGGDRFAPHTLVGAIGEFSSVLATIPEEYRESAEIDFEPEYSHGEAFQRVTITYQRPMTPDELAADDEFERRHWLEQLNNAQERIALCERKLAALNADTPQVVAA